MRNLLKYLILHILCFGCLVPLSAGEDSSAEAKRNALSDEVIDIFHDSMGFDYLTKEESEAINVDSILNSIELILNWNGYS